MVNYNELIGIPFHEYGDSLERTNCYNLLRMAFKKHGLIVPPTSIAVCACKSASNQEIEDNILQYWSPIETPEVPCGILIQSTNPDFANHIGVYVGDGRMLHVSISTNSVIERIFPRYTNKIIGYYKFTPQGK